ncbi:HlyD family type I secretion periplasmic adaptor subunit [Caenispirillum salinarum]|uniref:HlyD family type I secretion periplasmic adaptor subunit n=1 Tax=Caenispirillum salinarum TaxID=859058 RepID=UPI003850138E
MTASASPAGPPADGPLDDLLRTRKAPGWRIVAGLIAALLAVAVGWSALAELDEVSVASGEVVPRSKVKVIQHLEGGIITDIYVPEGAVVKSGDPLLQLDLAQTAMNKDELQVRLDGLLLEKARQEAEATGAELSLPADVAARRPSIAAGEREAFGARRAELAAQIAVLAEQVEQRSHEIRELEARQETLRKSENLARQKLAMSAELLRDNLTPKLDHLKLRSELEDIQGELSVLKQMRPRVEAALAEAEQRMGEATLRYRREARDQLAQTEVAIARTREVLRQATDQALRTEIRSPIDGVVKNMRYSTLGGVVKGGEPIMDIVPTGDTLVIEARLDPVDRGYVRVGQPATVKVSTYDYARYGGLEGEVTLVAPDSTQPENAPPYFQVLVETEKDYLGAMPGDLAITPGMQATVDIHTGTRSVLDYLIRPVLKLKHEAFRER